MLKMYINNLKNATLSFEIFLKGVTNGGRQIDVSQMRL